MMSAKKPIGPATPDVCPVCGEELRRGARACPECGADHRSGWRDEATSYDGVDLPQEDFDYAAFVEDEFGGGVKPRGIHPVWWITAVLLVIAFVAFYLYAVGR